MLGIKQFDKLVSFGTLKVSVNMDDDNSVGLNLLRKIQADSFFADSSNNKFTLQSEFTGVKVEKGDTNSDSTDFIINASPKKEQYLFDLFKNFGVNCEFITEYFNNAFKESLKRLSMMKAVWVTLDTPEGERVITTEQVQKMCKRPPDKLGLEQSGENTWKIGDKFSSLYKTVMSKN